MSNYKLVSVIIPTYKRADTLPRAIKSVLNQKYSNIEIVVVDDNSPDSVDRRLTEKAMEQFLEYSKVNYIKHEKNKNGSAARNTGFRNSNGDFIMFLDDDDEFINDKITSQVAKLESIDNSWGACYTNYVRKKDGKIVVYGAEKKEGTLFKEELMRNLFIHAGSNLMVRRSVVQEVNGFDESFQRNQDVEFLTRVLMKYKLAYVDGVGLIVHVHENKIGKEKFEEITVDYLNKFSSFINKLENEDKDMIYKMINLQLIRYFLTTKGKRIKAYSLIKNGNLNCFLLIRYLTHLLVRKFTKRAYGFDVK
ncbi:MAG: glycosyltransferase family 2 protein [Vulcanibacillus sp.]